MKGIAHFAAGVAVASCFPDAVRAGADGNPLYFILGGAFGLLPDTLDFKFYRFLYRHDLEVQPDPLKPDPQMIAEAVALAVNRACETGRPVRVKLNTIRLGADLWQRYFVTFDVPGRRVRVRYGPPVDTGSNPVPGAVAPTEREGSAALACGIKLEYEAETAVDIFDGPLFHMAPTADGRVSPVFISWHREWSHSFTAALVLALAAGLIWGPMAGLIVAGAFVAHIALDQVGHMGSNLFFPFQKARTAGMRLIHSGDPFPNFAAVWMACVIVFWNLYSALPWAGGVLSLAKLALFGAVLPLGLYRLMLGRKQPSE